MDKVKTNKMVDTTPAPTTPIAVGDKEKQQHEPAPPYHEVVAAQEGEHFSMAALMKGKVARDLTTFEKKAALINLEIDHFGLGRYQICIWFLCGFGYFLDLAWSQGVGLIASAVYQEMGVPPSQQGVIFSCANAGLAVGALSFGLLVDIIGRKWAFNLTCLITSVFGLLLAAPKYNYGAICGIYFLASLGLGGNIPIDATIALEFLPQNRRYLVPLLSLWQPVGVVAASGIAYGTAAKYRCGDGDTSLLSCRSPELAAGAPCCSVSSNMGWRYTVIVIGGATLLVFFLRYFVFTFYESPKFLISRGQYDDAIEVLHKIAKFNKAPPPTLTADDLRAVDHADGVFDAERPKALHRKMTFKEKVKHALRLDTVKHVVRNFVHSFGHLKLLAKNKLQMFIFALLAIAYMGDYWSFNLAGSFLPLILLRNNVDSGQGTVTDTYRQYVYIYLPGILGAVIALFSVQLPLVGRKWSLVFSALMQGMSMALYTQVTTTAGYVGLNALEYIMQTYFNAVLYASAPELFDTTYRGSASGMLSCLGRIAGIVAPFAGQDFLADQSSGILWLGAGGIWLSAVVLCFLPVEMRDRQMF